MKHMSAKSESSTQSGESYMSLYFRVGWETLTTNISSYEYTRNWRLDTRTSIIVRKLFDVHGGQDLSREKRVMGGHLQSTYGYCSKKKWKEGASKTERSISSSIDILLPILCYLFT